eukprot:g6160.t1
MVVLVYLSLAGLKLNDELGEERFENWYYYVRFLLVFMTLFMVAGVITFGRCSFFMFILKFPVAEEYENCISSQTLANAEWTRPPESCAVVSSQRSPPKRENSGGKRATGDQNWLERSAYHGCFNRKEVKDAEAACVVLDLRGKMVDVREASPKEVQDTRKEAQLLASFKHPFIVDYRSNFLDGGYLCIFMAFCEGGDLATQISSARDAQRRIAEPQVLRWMTQALLALKYIHDKHEYSPFVRSLCSEMLSKVPAKRPTAGAILSRAPLQSIVQSFFEEARAKAREPPEAKEPSPPEPESIKAPAATAACSTQLLDQMLNESDSTED